MHFRPLPASLNRPTNSNNECLLYGLPTSRAVVCVYISLDNEQAARLPAGYSNCTDYWEKNARCVNCNQAMYRSTQQQTTWHPTRYPAHYACS